MSEKLTVAELLARSGRTPTDDKDRPRRRRRSLEQGGVSVAELTGNIPVVKDEHLEADDAAQAKEADKAREREEAERKKAEERRKAEAERKAQAEREEAERKKAEERRKAEAERKAQAEREEAERKKKSSTASPVSAQDKGRADRPVEKPAGSSKIARPAAGAAAAATGATAANKLSKDPENKDSATSGKRVASGGKKRSGKSDKAVALSDHEEVRRLKEGLGEHEVLEYEDDQISWPAMIVQALLAIVVGVGVFFGFSLLWDRMGTGIVLILALAVTLFLVGIVHAILRHKDKWILLLAFVVGLVLTVGPRLILGM